MTPDPLRRLFCVAALGLGLLAQALQAQSPSSQPPAQAAPALSLGAILDEAVALCAAGRGERAQQLLLWLDAQADVPVGIAEIIAYYRQPVACMPGSAAHSVVPRVDLAAGFGRHHNINLGPSTERIFLAGWGQLLELAPASRPIDASASQFDAALSWDLGALGPAAKGLSVGVYAQHIRFAGEPSYGLRAAGATLAWLSPEAVATQRTALQTGLQQVRLGEGIRASTLQAGASQLWAVDEGAWAGLAGSWSALRFAERPSLDSTQLDLRFRGRREGRGWQLGIDLGWLEDWQKNQRDGGDRAGPFGQLQAQWAATPLLRLEGTVRLGRTKDSEPYIPAIFGPTIRSQRSARAQFIVRRRIDAHWSARIEARAAASHDTLALFTSDARSLMLWLDYSLAAPTP